MGVRGQGWVRGQGGGQGVRLGSEQPQGPSLTHTVRGGGKGRGGQGVKVGVRGQGGVRISGWGENRLRGPSSDTHRQGRGQGGVR